MPFPAPKDVELSVLVEAHCEELAQFVLSSDRVPRTPAWALTADEESLAQAIETAIQTWLCDVAHESEG